VAAVKPYILAEQTAAYPQGDPAKIDLFLVFRHLHSPPILSARGLRGDLRLPSGKGGLGSPTCGAGF
jgi:hypothetical protein